MLVYTCTGHIALWSGKNDLLWRIHNPSKRGHTTTASQMLGMKLQPEPGIPMECAHPAIKKTVFQEMAVSLSEHLLWKSDLWWYKCKLTLKNTVESIFYTSLKIALTFLKTC